MSDRKNRRSIVIHHDPEEIDESSITICNNLVLKQELDNDLVKLWESLKNKPKLIVFDLDLTLWPFWVDSHCTPPFKKIVNNNECTTTIVDEEDKKLTYFSDVPKILKTLRYCSSKNNSYLGVASRTNAYEAALQLLEFYEWKDYFDSIQMYSGSKVRHINHICQEFGIKSKQDVLFFDDETRNTEDVGPLGATAHLLDRR
jgi:magnesium-dependent phosphatase 1